MLLLLPHYWFCCFRTVLGHSSRACGFGANPAQHGAKTGLICQTPYWPIFTANLSKFKLKIYLILPVFILTPFVFFFLPSNYITFIFFTWTYHSQYKRKEEGSIYFGTPDVSPSKSLFPKRQLSCTLGNNSSIYTFKWCSHVWVHTPQ